ncbi:unnamed protein product [Didymodactylos carnosus]|uniref:Tetratricopeptide repeat protein n=1 Tax=Didymodactylos carnosus TaxID=1234261 RepID=A0A815BM56_9BILA|nr:unnamed protein product [Didymodactylos carnosus]CAF4055876.1 unnamed protein product [Didymodactylos carnosus]
MLRQFECYLKAISIRETLESCDKLAIANDYNCIGWYYGLHKEYDLGIEYCTKSTDIFEKFSLTDEQERSYSSVLNSLGVIYDGIGNFEKAFDYCQKSMKILEKLSSNDDSANTYNYEIFANIHLYNGEQKLAVEFYKKSLNLFKITRSHDSLSRERVEKKLVNINSEQTNLKI